MQRYQFFDDAGKRRIATITSFFYDRFFDQIIKIICQQGRLIGRKTFLRRDAWMQSSWAHFLSKYHAF